MWRRNEDVRNVKGCGEGMREPAARQESLAVPELDGGDPRDARNPWQCQKWLAGTRRVPENPGSARAGWREPAPRQESLAVPELAGEEPPHVRKPWQCQPWLESRYASPSYVGDWVCKISY